MLDTVTQVYTGLTERQRVEFLTWLAFHLSEVARGSYPDARSDFSVVVTELRTHNELLQVVLKQMLGALRIGGRRPAYPDDAFFDVLFEGAGLGSCESDLSWAVTKSFSDIGIPFPAEEE
jgi:hypothetical protein